MEIAFQANTGDLWTWTIGNPGSNTGLGMQAGSNPSVTAVAGIGSNHEIAFQANNGDLWTTGAFGQGDTGLGMAGGTSPSVAFSENRVSVEQRQRAPRCRRSLHHRNLRHRS
jgi:hypothetical protein